MKANRPLNIYTSSFTYKFRVACDKFIDDYSIKNDVNRIDAENELLKVICCNRTLYYKYRNGERNPSDEDVILFTNNLGLHSEDLIEDSPVGDGILERIRRLFVTLDPASCHKISIFYKYYSQIHDNAWTFIINHALLNELGRLEIKRFISASFVPLDSVIAILNALILFQEAKNIGDDILFSRYEQDKNDFFNSMKNGDDKLYISNKWDVLKKQLIGSPWSDKERFYRQMPYITKMDSEDWTLLIGYFLLDNKSEYIPSQKQEELLLKSEEFIRNIHYSDEAEFIINNF